MIRILYLHGLESEQGGAKVEYLSANHYVYAPSIQYSEPNLLERIISSIEIFKPDVIIGSSMGGYLANELSIKFGIPAILLNPALLSPPVRVNINDKEMRLSDKLIVIVLGKFDTVVPYRDTLDLLQKSCHCRVDVREYGHRTPFEEFIDICEKYLN
jgi:hypothetical protein